MSGLSQVCIHNIRCVKKAEFTLHPDFTLFYGQNGSGKTSLLEALHLLSLARSFRTPNINKVISDHSSSCSIGAEFMDDTGLERKLIVGRSRDGETRIQIDHQSIQTSAELTALLPVRVISQESHSLLDGPSKGRRQLIDWLAFHVEPQFNQCWGTTQRLLKQRNALLKNNVFRHAELLSWDRELAQQSEKLNTQRQAVFEIFNVQFQKLLSDLLPASPLTLRLYQGWPEHHGSLQDCLSACVEQDRKLGYTQHSPNRADIVIKQGNKLAAECLSRGQKKLLVYALALAQIQTLSLLLKEQNRFIKILVLIDDIGAELDAKNQNLLLETLTRCNSQVVITGTELNWLYDTLGQGKCKMFHVEQGVPTPTPHLINWSKHS